MWAEEYVLRGTGGTAKLYRMTVASRNVGRQRQESLLRG